MAKKVTKKAKSEATIRNAGPQLAELLPQYEYKNHETRNYSNGKGVLYVRLTRITPPVKLRVA